MFHLKEMRKERETVSKKNHFIKGRPDKGKVIDKICSPALPVQPVWSHPKLKTFPVAHGSQRSREGWEKVSAN